MIMNMVRPCIDGWLSIKASSFRSAMKRCTEDQHNQQGTYDNSYGPDLQVIMWLTHMLIKSNSSHLTNKAGLLQVAEHFQAHTQLLSEHWQRYKA